MIAFKQLVAKVCAVPIFSWYTLMKVILFRKSWFFLLFLLLFFFFWRLPTSRLPVHLFVFYKRTFIAPLSIFLGVPAHAIDNKWRDIYAWWEKRESCTCVCVSVEKKPERRMSFIIRQNAFSLCLFVCLADVSLNLWDTLSYQELVWKKWLKFIIFNYQGIYFAFSY